MPAFGVYPIADAMLDGEEISSTYEGRHLTFLESELTHEPGLSFVTKGHPVVCGNIVGIPFGTCTAATDLVVVDTEGIWIVDVNAADDGGNVAVAGGDRLYINTTTCVVSKIATAASQIPFGYALGIISSGLTERIAVKVHWDPIDNALLDKEPLYFGDGRDAALDWDTGLIGAGETLLLTVPVVSAGSSAFQIDADASATLQDVGIACYFDATFAGQATGNWMYAGGIWLNLTTTFDESAGGYGGHFQLTPWNTGIYGTTLVDCDLCDMIYGIKAEYVMTSAVHGIYFAALNVAGPTVAANHIAIFYAMNAESVGWTGATKAGVAGGSIALAYVNGSGYDGVLYVNVWQS